MSSPSQSVQHFDVLIIGAGISGIGAAYELKQQCPDMSFAVLEGLESFGGTWLWHKYPGVRSDSDLYTFGYRFKPWLGAPIASAQEILKYLGEVISENDLDRHIHYQHRVVTAAWNSDAALWTLDVICGGDATPAQFTCNFLWMCQGYYRHAKGHTPAWPDMDRFSGPVIHPQTWPEDLSYKDKKVVVIGSGATAATVVPAIAEECAHVTLLQRSPSYFSPGRNRHWLADVLRELSVDEAWIHEIVRRRIVADQAKFLRHAIDEPEAATDELLKGVRAYLPDDVVDVHFTPSYRPWRQRIAVAPDGDLFKCITSGKASIVTDHIERFVEQGVRLKSGQTLDADIIVTATGFDICVLGDIRFVIDGEVLNFAETITYRGLMFTGVPNMAWIFGYFRAASWTLRVDLVADFICRLLRHMKSRGARTVEVALRPEDMGMKLLPWIDDEVFNPGYLMRGMHLLPKRGDKSEWAHSQDYWWERDVLPLVDLDDPVFVYGGAMCSAERPDNGTAAVREIA
ncbi:MAG: NAD(P)/FAD-dependent oxidoreductase [Hyphomonadaceae bacterium]|nr:NAD(P)/FAD-dependent oxidoreductase [Hyphomonadaceae bacterium]